MSTDSYFLATGGSGIESGIAAYANPGFSFDVGVVGLGGVIGVTGGIDDGVNNPFAGLPARAVYSVSAAIVGGAASVPGVAGVSWGVGVFGQAGQFPTTLSPDMSCGVLGTSAYATGVVGFSDQAVGVSGFSQSNVGVRGEMRKSGPGVPKNQQVFAGAAGVVGTSGEMAGVVGTSTHSYGVYGFSTDASNTAGVAGDLGSPGPAVPMTQQTVAAVAGVRGTSDQKTGVVGTSNSSYGVYGFSTKSAGIVGDAGPTAYAGVFNGKVAVNGLFSAAVKAAVVPFPDGSKRVLYCMESPDHWFEDFGAAKLKRGRVVVKLDADFAKVIKRGDYKVFVTPEGECRGLSVRRKRAASFEVRELMDGRSSTAFSYRIVGRRKDVRSHRRFPKFDLPPSMRPAPRQGRTRSPLGALLTKVRKQAGARAGRARRRKTARAPQPLPSLLAKLRKQAGAKPVRRRKRGKKRA